MQQQQPILQGTSVPQSRQQAEVWLSRNVIIWGINLLFNTCSHLCLVHLLCPEQQPFLPGIISCLIQMEQVHSEQHPASSQPAPSQERETECFHTHHISSSVLSTVTVWLKFFSQSHYHKGSLRDFTGFFISLKKAPKLWKQVKKS